MCKKWEEVNLKSLVADSSSFVEIIKKLELKICGGSYKTLKKYIKLYNIDTSHFLSRSEQFTRIKPFKYIKKINLSELFTVNNYKNHYSTVKKAIIDNNIFPYKCLICEISSWNGMKLTLQLDHINGDCFDHRLENLRLLCPNCHSQTNTYTGKNNR